ncbi:MAG: tetratricopeptide repeat protein [Phycisphaerae bacterium]|nr:tetratricopeptide repeat protein [Phycisphaerae bacterium]
MKMGGRTCVYEWVAVLVVCAAAGSGCGRRSGDGSSDGTGAESTSTDRAYAGSVSCRECHERFYTLWAPSHHGLAMQPYRAALARAELTPQTDAIKIGRLAYRAETAGDAGLVRETGPEGEKTYPIVHVLGGKNVYYFLTPLDKGRLQTLPVAYDVNRKAWYDTAASGVRHFPDRRDEAIDWRDRPYTFNSSCYSCHVSQLSTNYDEKTDTYHTIWAEPGINCETCHGPGDEHVRVCKEAEGGPAPRELKIISTKRFTVEQTNAMCAPCHAKMASLTTTFVPGERYFDHYDLTTLEHIDFYPDGRDLGENYTFTLWRMSPCVKSGKLDCVHCHTSSGRYRFAGQKTNEACMPCHEGHVKNPTGHSHHKAESEGSQCVACHMPMTEFARMRRSDHSMRSPAPTATIRYKSPNACNICHKDKDAAWSDEWARKWYPRDYQGPMLHQADLIAAARRHEWARLPEMLEAVTAKDRDEIVANSLVRLLRFCDDNRKWPVLMAALKDVSPLVRASAAEALSDRTTPEVVAALLGATRDDYRLVRIRAAAALSAVPPGQLDSARRKDLDRAVAEFQASMKARPDDAAGHYNLGNFHMNRRETQRAIEEFERSAELDPQQVPPLVNASIAYNLLGKNDRAEASLRRALKLDPCSVAANLNLGLLLGEMGRLGESEGAFRAALKTDPNNAVAAYNLGVIVAKDRLDEGIEWCRKALKLRPDDPRYAFTVAFYQRQKGDVDAAVATLRRAIARQPASADVYMLLGEIHEQQGKREEAVAVYRRAMENVRLGQREHQAFAAKIQALSEP